MAALAAHAQIEDFQLLYKSIIRYGSLKGSLWQLMAAYAKEDD